MQIIGKLAPETVEAAINYINAHLLPLASAEQAKCAKGRLNLWLNAEPNYRTKTYIPAYRDDRVWKFCKQIFPEGDLCQIYFAKGMRGIDWHPDGAYAAPDARIVNLGKVRLECQVGGTVEVLDLSGGEIIQFNCKCRHRAIPLSEDRIGIGIWKAAIPIPDDLPVLSRDR